MKFNFTTLAFALALTNNTAFAQAVTSDPTSDLCTYAVVNGAPDPTTIQCGVGAQAGGENSIAIGNNAYASGENSIVIGVNSSAMGTAVVVGNINSASGSSNIFGSSNNGINANIHGSNNRISGMGIGTNPATPINSFGNNNDIANGPSPSLTNYLPTSSFGSENYIRGYNNTNSGSGNFVKGSGNFVGGANVTLSGENNVVIGNNSSMGFSAGGIEEPQNGLVIVGENAKGFERCSNSLALGQNSECNESNIASFGNENLKRRLTNIAGGYAATDAVNLSQLNQVAGALGGGASYMLGTFTAPTYALSGGNTFRDVGSALNFLDSRIVDLENNPGAGSGATGPAGVDGKSAYQIAVDNGFSGSEPEWLASLKGDKGDKGDPGRDGVDGIAGKDGAQGPKGDKGDPGRDGVDGIAGKDGAQGPKGDKGDPGRDGVDGIAGKDGAQGPKGDKGDPGRDGVDGIAGKDGAQGPKGDKGEAGAAGGSELDELAVRYDTADKSSVTLKSANGGNTRVSGVADGRIEQGSTDAVNGGQIWEINDSWERKFDETNKNIEKMGAQSAALTMAASSVAYLPVGKVAFTSGVGFYGKEAAVAVGFKVRVSEKSALSAAFSFANGKAMGGFGYSYIFE